MGSHDGKQGGYNQFCVAEHESIASRTFGMLVSGFFMYTEPNLGAVASTA